MHDFLELIRPLLTAYGGDMGMVMQIISIIGSLRLINKPLFSMLRAIVEVTYWTEADNIFLKNLESSKIYKGLLFILDWMASVKPLKDKK